MQRRVPGPRGMRLDDAVRKDRPGHRPELKQAHPVRNWLSQATGWVTAIVILPSLYPVSCSTQAPNAY